MDPGAPILSLAIIVKDEAANLPRWLAAAGGLGDELVAVDSGSSDATVQLLEAAGARVFKRAWSGYADQRNHAAEQCRGQWIVFMDADEVPDLQLRQALLAFKAAPPAGPRAFRLQRKVIFLGRFLRHGGFFPEHVLRLYQAGAGRWAPREVHERLEVDGPLGTLPGYLEHYSYRTVGQYLRRMERYSAEAARHLRFQGRGAGPLTVWLHASWAFWQRYLLRLGFLDGYPGFLAARLESFYTLAKYARLRELNQPEARP